MSSERAGPKLVSARRPARARQWANLPVRWLLRSPLHGIVDGRLMLITARGRSSGRSFTIPVGYAAGVDGWYVLVGRHGSKRWWRNLEGGAEVTLTIHGKTIRAHARVMRWHTNHSMFESALALYLSRFPETARRLGVAMPGGIADRAALREVARDSVMVRAARPHLA